MSVSLFTFAVAALPAFLASVVEWVEAFTIVLAVGNTRGWRSPIWGTIGGLGTPGDIVRGFRPTPGVFPGKVKQRFSIFGGLFLLLFWSAWFGKGILMVPRLLARHAREVMLQ